MFSLAGNMAPLHCPHIVISLVILGLAGTTIAENRIYHSAYFRHENTVHITQKSWVITFDLDVSQHYDWLDGLDNTYNQLVAEYNGMQSFGVHENIQNHSTVAVYEKLITQQHSEFEDIRSRLLESRSYLDSITPLYRDVPKHRHKRSLLPFVGDILSTLFGTASKKDLNHVSEYLEALGQSDSQIRHIVEQSLTVLNYTSLHVVANRRKINELIDMSETMQAIFTTETKELLDTFRHFTLRYLQVQEQLGILRRAVIEFTRELDSLRDKLSEALQGKVTPHLLPPERLSNIVHDIQDHLEANIRLPFPHFEALEQFYRVLQCSVLPAQTGFLLLTHIPLQDTISSFDIYAVQTLPIPYRDSQIISKYQIENKYFAISMDHTKIAFLEEFQIRMCNHEEMQFCPIQSPIYTTAALENNCVVSLFLQRDNVAQVCKAIVSTSDIPSPAAAKLDSGHWAVTTNIPVVITKLCPESRPERITVEPPMGILTLDKGCQANSDFVNLPAEFDRHSNLPSLRINFSIPHLMSIWDPVDEILQQSLIEVPTKLDAIVSEEPTLARLAEALTNEVKPLKHKRSSYIILVIVLSAIVFLLCLGALLLCIYHIRCYLSSLATKGSVDRQTNMVSATCGQVERVGHPSVDNATSCYDVDTMAPVVTSEPSDGEKDAAGAGPGGRMGSLTKLRTPTSRSGPK